MLLILYHTTCISNLHWMGDFCKSFPDWSCKKERRHLWVQTWKFPVQKKETQCLSLMPRQRITVPFFNGMSPCDTLKKNHCWAPKVVPAALCNLSTASDPFVKAAWWSNAVGSVNPSPPLCPGHPGVLVHWYEGYRTVHRSTTAQNRVEWEKSENFAERLKLCF